MDDAVAHISRSGGTRPGAMILAATSLLAIGVVMVASTSASLDRSLFGASLWRTPFGRQLIFALAGFVVMVITSRLAVPLLASPELRHGLSRLLFVLAVIGLLAVVIPKASPCAIN